MRSRTDSELSDEEKALWIQSGLAVSPLMGTCLQYSLDFCLAWALIGEWTSRVLFPVPKGPWPRHGHAGALLQAYQCRTPRIVAWAQAAFEQGVSSLLMMPGIAPVFSLPGDRMFQATEVAEGYQRPAIMHAYGGAKTGVERSLASIAPEGWFPMAAAMLGTVDKPPMWASVGLRPVVGTTIDFKVLPPILSERETNLYPPLTCDLHTGSGIGASSWFHQSHLLSMLVLLLWHRGCLSDITGALFCCPGTLSGWFPVSPPFAFVCCFKRPFCMFLS